MIRLRGDIKRALEISKWLKEKGLKHPEDFNWHHFNHHNIVFNFRDPKWESITIMKWS